MFEVLRFWLRKGVDGFRVAAMLLLTLPGTITMYYGDEIGMPNAFITPEEVQDPAEKNEPGIGRAAILNELRCAETGVSMRASPKGARGCHSAKTSSI